MSAGPGTAKTIGNEIQIGRPRAWTPKRMRLLPVQSIVTGNTADTKTRTPSNTGALRNQSDRPTPRTPITDSEERAEEHALPMARDMRS